MNKEMDREQEIKYAISLLEISGYVVIKETEKMKKDGLKCDDCSQCSARVCIYNT